MADTSFPFLRIAKMSGLRYGHVLAYRDALVKLLYTPRDVQVFFDFWEAEAEKVIGACREGVGKAIYDAVLKEQGRRHMVVTGDCRHD